MVWNLLNQQEHSSRSVYINYTAIVIFVVLAGLLAGGVHALHVRQVAKHQPLVLAEAKKRAAAGEDAAALAYYQTYLGYRPKDDDAIAEHALLKAKVAKNANSTMDAFYALLRAMGKVPERADVRRELIKVAVKLGRANECEGEIDKLLDQAPGDLEALKLAARAAVQLRDFSTARVRYEKLIDLGADEPENFLDLFRLLSTEFKDQAAADALLVRLLKRHPDSGDLRVMAGAYYFRRGQLALADEQISIAVNDLQVTDPALQRLQAEIARQRRRPLEFEARLNELAKTTETDLRLEFQLAEIDLSLGRRQPARERLLKIARHEQATAEQVWQVIALLAGIEATEQEAELRERLKQLDAAEKFTPALAMLDRMRQEDWQTALELSRGLMRQTDLSPGLTVTLSMWRAECYSRLNDIPEQINCYRRAIDANPDYQPARSRLAQTLFRRGQFKDAQGEYATLIETSPVYAREFVTELLRAQSPDAPVPMSVADVDRLFARWRESAPNNAVPVLCQLDLLQRKGDDVQAAQLTAEGLQKWPKEIGFRVAKLDRLLRDKDWDEAWKALNDAEANCGAQPILLVRRILCLEGLNPPDQTARLLDCAEQFAKLDRDGQAQVWPIIIRGLQRAGVDPLSVQSMLDEYGERNPGDALARLVRLQNAVSSGDLKTARQHLDALRTAVGAESPSYRLASILCDVKAASLGDRADLARARSSLEELRKSSAQFPPQLLTLAADLDLLEQHPAAALANLQEALRLGDARSSTLTRIVALMVLSGQLDQTVPYLRSLGQQESSDPAAETEPPKVIAGMLPRKRDLSSLRTVLAAAADDSWPVALAAFRVDLELQQPDRAAEMIQLALKSAPQTPLIWANWFAYLERYQPDRLDQALTEVEDQLPLIDRARLLPPILLKLNRVAAAETLLTNAWEQAPLDPVIFRTYVQLLRQKSGKENQQKVETLLNETLARQEAESAPVREIARREMARLKSASRDYRRYQEAVALAAEIVQQAAPEDEEAWMLQGEVNAAHSAHWKDAVAAFQKLTDSPRREVRAEALFQSARVYEQHRQWDQQAAVLTSLLELNPDQPQLLTQLLLNAVRRKDAAAADRIYKDLVPLVKDDVQALMCETLISSLSDDHAKVVAKILAAREEDRITPEMAYEWLSLLKADDECDALLQKQLETKKPEAQAKYALFLASHGRVKDALPILSQLWKSGARDISATVAAAMSSSPLVAPEDLEAVRTALIKLSEREETGVPLLVAAAALEDHAGRHAEAMGLYRRILAQSPDHVVALNNLAFLEAVSTPALEASALEHIRRATELYGPNDQLQDTEGVVLLRNGDAKSALDRFQQAWEQRPEINYLAHKAWALTELGQYKDAAAAFQQVDAADHPPRFHALERSLDAAWRKQLLDKQSDDATATN